ncbi:WD40 repeat domain-containing protein [Streptomyces sp. NPDC088400]|uniref:WD40 repeat domain-containing protein n=1 Tax=Streptomyces sp. NPDC088400 TaxID=3365861 RepID=UPI0037F9B495
MELPDRIVRIVYVDGTGLLASDIHGRVHLLDAQLRVVRSSSFVQQGRPLYGLAAAEGWIIGKDRMGAIFRWSLDTLELVDRLDPATVCDPSTLIPREHPSPVSSRGIGIWDGRVFVSSGYHRQMLVLDLHTFEVLEVRPNICGESPMEWACTDHPTRHAVSDKKGNLRFGSFTDAEFPDLVKLDDGNIHRVRYDARHDRFWATQDFGAGENADIANGVVIVSASGEKEDECLFARDDVEFVTFSPDHLRAYAGGFDGELHIFDNTTRELRIARTVTGFPHQLSDLTVGAGTGTDVGTGADVYVLCQDGEIIQLDAEGEFVRAAGFRRQAVWDIQPSAEDPRTLYCATDTGVAVVHVRDSAAGPMLRVEAEHTTGFGFTRRVAPVRSGWLGITRDHRAFRADHDGTLRWSDELPALPHTVAVSPDGARALVATNAGAVELDIADGRRLDLFDVDGLPVWAATYLPDGDRLLITRNGVIVVLDRADATVRWRLDQGEYPKRLWVQNGRAYITGDGGVKELAVGGGVVARWSKLLSNTIENAVVSDGLVCASSYGMQLAGYDYTTGAFLGLVEDLPDYPKALSMIHDAAGVPHLLVGCRTGILSLFQLERRPKKLRFRKLRDHWLSRHPAAYTLKHHDHDHNHTDDHTDDQAVAVTVTTTARREAPCAR